MPMSVRHAARLAAIASDAEFRNPTEATQAAAWRAHCVWRKAKSEADVARQVAARNPDRGTPAEQAAAAAFRAARGWPDPR